MGHYNGDGKWVYDAMDEASGYGCAGTQNSPSYQSNTTTGFEKENKDLKKRIAELEAEREADRAALRLALDALEGFGNHVDVQDAITALREALGEKI